MVLFIRFYLAEEIGVSLALVPNAVNVAIGSIFVVVFALLGLTLRLSRLRLHGTGAGSPDVSASSGSTVIFSDPAKVERAPEIRLDLYASAQIWSALAPMRTRPCVCK